MVRWLRFLPLFALAGCVPLQLFDGSGAVTTPMPLTPFGSSAPVTGTPTVKTNYAPAAADLSLRVDYVGRQVLRANKQINFSPLFATIGAPQAELFHVGSGMVYVTDGLVKQCKTDGELAALLCLELGKMVAEREAVAPQLARNPERRPPLNVPIGNAGQFTSGDNVGLAELAKYEKERQKTGKRTPPPDPSKLARDYLEKAGFKASDLDAVASLLTSAERNYQLEKHLKDNPQPQQPAWQANQQQEPRP